MIHSFPELARELQNDFEKLPFTLYMLLWNEHINLMNGYRMGDYSLYSTNDKQLKYKLEIEHEIKMGRLKPQDKISFDKPILNFNRN